MAFTPDPYLAGMPSVVIRLWLPDRPGALGQVASRIGALRGDVTGIEILERGDGQVIDELVVEFDGEVDLTLLVREVRQVDGVAVEDARPAGVHARDRGQRALDLAAEIVSGRMYEDGFETLVAFCVEDLECLWATVVSRPERDVAAVAGDPPDPAWLSAFVAGIADCTRPPDAVFLRFPTLPLDLVALREGRPLHRRETARLASLVTIVDATARQTEGLALRP
jgi:hypothetical protein